MQFPSPTRFRVLAQEFGALHRIPHIIEAIDGTHIMIFAPLIGRNYYYYYYRKLFHSTLLQDIVYIKYVFWNKFGWTRSMHNWTLF